MKFEAICLGLTDQCQRDSISVAYTGDTFIVTAIDQNSRPMAAIYKPQENKFSDFIAIPGKVVGLLAGSPIAAVGYDSKICLSGFPHGGWATLQVSARSLVLVYSTPYFRSIYTLNKTLIEARYVIQQNQALIVENILANDVEERSVKCVSSNGRIKVAWLDGQHQAFSREFSNRWLDPVNLGFRTVCLWTNDSCEFRPAEKLLGGHFGPSFCTIDDVVCGLDSEQKVYIFETHGESTTEESAFRLEIDNDPAIYSCGSLCGIKHRSTRFFFHQAIDSSVWCFREVSQALHKQEEDSDYY